MRVFLFLFFITFVAGKVERRDVNPANCLANACLYACTSSYEVEEGNLIVLIPQEKNLPTNCYCCNLYERERSIMNSDAYGHIKGNEIISFSDNGNCGNVQIVVSTGSENDDSLLLASILVDPNTNSMCHVTYEVTSGTILDEFPKDDLPIGIIIGGAVGGVILAGLACTYYNKRSANSVVDAHPVAVQIKV